MKKIIIPLILIILGLLIYVAYQQGWFESKEQKYNNCLEACTEKTKTKGLVRDDEGHLHYKSETTLSQEEEKSLNICENQCIQKYK